MVSDNEILNFLQDFGCAKPEHLQILFDLKNDNFKRLLSSNMVSKKDGIYVHNTKRIDNRMLIALDLLCKYKFKLKDCFIGYDPIQISFISKLDEIYHIIVADDDNRNGVVRLINTSTSKLPKADKFLLLFPDANDLGNISNKVKYMYIKYPEMEIMN